MVRAPPFETAFLKGVKKGLLGQPGKQKLLGKYYCSEVAREKGIWRVLIFKNNHRQCNLRDRKRRSKNILESLYMMSCMEVLCYCLPDLSEAP